MSMQPSELWDIKKINDEEEQLSLKAARCLKKDDLIMTQSSVVCEITFHTKAMSVEKVKVLLFRLFREGLPRPSGKGRCRLQRLVQVEPVRNRG